MVDRRFFSAEVKTHTGPSIVPAGGMSLFYNLEGIWELGGFAAAKGDLAVVESEEALVLKGTGALLEISLAAL